MRGSWRIGDFKKYMKCKQTIVQKDSDMMCILEEIGVSNSYHYLSMHDSQVNKQRNVRILSPKMERSMHSKVQNLQQKNRL